MGYVDRFRSFFRETIHSLFDYYPVSVGSKAPAVVVSFLLCFSESAASGILSAAFFSISVFQVGAILIVRAKYSRVTSETCLHHSHIEGEGFMAVKDSSGLG